MTKPIPKDNIDYLRMALALSGISCDSYTAELIIELWEAIKKKGGQFNISDSTMIEWRLKKKYQKVRAVKDKTIEKELEEIKKLLHKKK